MLMSSKVIFPLETKPHLTMLVHRARSEAQSLPGKFITKEIRFLEAKLEAKLEYVLPVNGSYHKWYCMAIYKQNVIFK